MSARERGSTTAEMPGAVLVLALFLDLLLGMVRYYGTGGPVNTAAADAARAVARGRPSSAQANAESAAAAALESAAPRCISSTVRLLDTRQLRPGGEARVQVACTISFKDLAYLPFPGSVTVVSEPFSFPVALRREET